MERWLLVIAIVLAVCGSAGGMVSVHHGRRSRWTVVWMAGALLCQVGFLALRGKLRQACPLGDAGEILVFLSWSLTLFYLLVGPAYRISLLGVFTAPLVVVFQSVALVPGLLESAPHPAEMVKVNGWHEMHAATSVLAYGAFALAAVAGVMFRVLDRQLKEHHLQSGLFRGLPAVRELLISLERLLWLGSGLLTIGIIAGFLMPHNRAVPGHLVTALLVWVAYVCLLGIKSVRGLTGRRLSLAVVVIFLLSLVVFAFVV